MQVEVLENPGEGWLKIRATKSGQEGLDGRLAGHCRRKLIATGPRPAPISGA